MSEGNWKQRHYIESGRMLQLIEGGAGGKLPCPVIGRIIDDYPALKCYPKRNLGSEVHRWICMYAWSSEEI